jgi:hypothetical protein
MARSTRRESHGAGRQIFAILTATAAGLGLVACSADGSLGTVSASDAEHVGAVGAAVGAAQKIGVPSYYWFDAADWTGVTSQNSVGLAMLNPLNGRLEQLSVAAMQGFQNRFAQLQAQSPRPLVFGYVYTRYANTDPNLSDGGVHNRDVATVEANINQYFSNFPTIDGIFLDEATHDCGSAGLGYYQDIYQWLQSNHPGKKIALNPGTSTSDSECYLRGTSGDPRKAGDILVTFEGTFTKYVKCTARPAWEMNYPAETFWHLVYSTPTAEVGHALALSRTRNAGWVYVTDQSGWTTITSNIAAEGADVAQNGGTYSSVHHFSAAKGSTDYTFSATFDSGFTYHQAFIDSKAGGFAISGVAADYLIENANFRVYGGSGSDWTWNLPPSPAPSTSNQTLNGATYSWSIPLSSISVSNQTISAAFRGGNSPSVTTPSCVIP